MAQNGAQRSDYVIVSYRKTLVAHVEYFYQPSFCCLVVCRGRPLEK